MKMKILFALVLVILGWLAVGFGYTTTFSGSLASILFIGGILLFIAGIIYFILAVRR
jgi:hypothetical protein